MNTTVMTVTGPIDPAALGHTVTDVRLLGAGAGSADLPEVPVRIESIEGLSDDESQALLRDLMQHATQKKYEYRHAWKYGDMVIWDNRSVLHQANGDYDMSETRRLYRIMVKGTPLPGELAASGNAHASRPAPALS